MVIFYSIILWAIGAINFEVDLNGYIFYFLSRFAENLDASVEYLFRMTNVHIL